MSTTVTVWVLVMYVLHAPPPMVTPPDHIAYEQTFKTKELCLSAKSKEEREDARRGIADNYVYRCVPRHLEDAP